MGITRLNHAVLYVRDASASMRFYTDVLGFTVRSSIADKAFFLQASDSDNDHDLGLFEVGPVGAARGAGLYHLAWQVRTVDELVALRRRLLEVGAFVGESDHGVSKSLYARDIDGIEFEIMWATPRSEWPAEVGTWPLDLPDAVTRWSGLDTTGR
jgi:catechol-2,3-dioxygenase